MLHDQTIQWRQSRDGTHKVVRLKRAIFLSWIARLLGIREMVITRRIDVPLKIEP